jgi:hypothetical protein
MGSVPGLIEGQSALKSATTPFGKIIRSREERWTNLRLRELLLLMPKLCLLLLREDRNEVGIEERIRKVVWVFCVRSKETKGAGQSGFTSYKGKGREKRTDRRKTSFLSELGGKSLQPPDDENSYCRKR